MGTAHARPVGRRAIVLGAIVTDVVACTSYPMDPEVALVGRFASGDSSWNGTDSAKVSWNVVGHE